MIARGYATFRHCFWARIRGSIVFLCGKALVNTTSRTYFAWQVSLVYQPATGYVCTIEHPCWSSQCCQQLAPLDRVSRCPICSSRRSAFGMTYSHTRIRPVDIRDDRSCHIRPAIQAAAVGPPTAVGLPAMTSRCPWHVWQDVWSRIGHCLGQRRCSKAAGHLPPVQPLFFSQAGQSRKVSAPHIQLPLLQAAASNPPPQQELIAC